MAEKHKRCPSCSGRMPASATVCPRCKTELQVTVWEIQQTASQATCFRGREAVSRIKSGLISGTLKLSDMCRQRIEVLDRIENGEPRYSVKKEKRWDSLSAYARREFELHVLFAPARAYARLGSHVGFPLVAIPTAVYWSVTGLMYAGASPLNAVLLGILMLLSVPTVILAVPVFLIVSRIYDVPAFALTFFSYVYGVVGGGVVGFTIGAAVGALLAVRKKPVVTVE